jgi:hypothetical protein
MDAATSHDQNADQVAYWNGSAGQRGAVPSDAGPPRDTGNWRALQLTSTGLAIPTAISFAAFTQLILVEACISQFGAHIPANWSPAGLPISAAISFAPLAQRVLIFAGKS